MPFIALLRHGEEEGVGAPGTAIHTRSPSGLSSRGREQAEAARRFLEPLAAERVVCSDAARAIETAEIIAAGRPVEAVPDLGGFFLGEWEGRSASELGDLAELVADPERRAPGGESLADLLRRARPALAASLPSEGDAIVVAHRMVNAVLIADMLRLPLASAGLIQQDNCGVNLLERNGTRLVPAMINVNPSDPLRRGITTASLV